MLGSWISSVVEISSPVTGRASLAVPLGGPNIHDIRLPLLEWSDAAVFDYLKSIGATLPRFYENGRVKGFDRAYLKKYHPALAASYRADLEKLWPEIARAL